MENSDILSSEPFTIIKRIACLIFNLQHRQMYIHTLRQKMCTVVHNTKYVLSQTYMYVYVHEMRQYNEVANAVSSALKRYTINVCCF